MTKADLCRQIDQIFSNVPYPGDNDLTVHPLGFDECFYEAIKGKNYKEVARAVYTEHHDCIGVLTPKGFQYYLPGFLITDLESEFSAIFGQLTYWLSYCQHSPDSPIKGLSGKNWLNPRIDLLSSEQKRILIQYFDYYKSTLLIEEEMAAVETIIEFLNSRIGENT